MKIGNVIFEGFSSLAPMAGLTDRAFREVCRGFGASYTVSEMISSKGISYNSKKSEALMVLSDSERPCGIQIFGDEPQTMAQAAEFSLKYSPDMIDINMGCPAPKISSGGSGAALMKNPSLCGEIVNAVSKAVDVPVTVKIRKGFDNDHVNAVEVAKICEQNGAQAITVHGRTRQQYFAFPVDFDIIRDVKNSVGIPVIGNGGIRTAQDAQKMIEYTGCDHVMIGQAALGNPWIFKEINAYFMTDRLIPSVSIEERLSVMTKHIEKMCEYKGEKVAMLQSRKHVAHYLKGLRGAAVFRDKACRLAKINDLYTLCREIYEVNKYER